LHECGGHRWRKDSSGGRLLRLAAWVWAEDKSVCDESGRIVQLRR
jgi:hypothetical protein